MTSNYDSKLSLMMFDLGEMEDDKVEPLLSIRISLSVSLSLSHSLIQVYAQIVTLSVCIRLPGNRNTVCPK